MSVNSINFTKMHGLGNDYVYVDCFRENLSREIDLHELAVAIADRRFGVGGDGLVLILPSDNADCKMRMFNSDGSEGRMCGNAIRCIGRYLFEEGYTKSEQITIETLSGIKTVSLEFESGEISTVSASLGKISFQSRDLPFKCDSASSLGHTLEIDGRSISVNCASVGNPHCVIFVDRITDSDVLTLGPKIERHPSFPEGVNVEFIRVISRELIEMRVWERGSGETSACGTGAGAAFATAHKLELVDAVGVVRLAGGDLAVEVTPDWEVITTGEAVRVFEGDYLLPEFLLSSAAGDIRQLVNE